MPYRTDAELPDSVKRALPSHAQDIYREAFVLRDLEEMPTAEVAEVLGLERVG